MEQILLPMEQSNKKEYIDKRSADFTKYPKLFRGSYW
jgi:hypothetical protein